MGESGLYEINDQDGSGAPIARSWLCEGADRRRMLDMEARIRPVRMITMGVIAGGLALAGPWIGYWTLLPLAAAAACFAAADRLAGRIRFPEYAMAWAWVASQVAIGAGIALSGGPESPALALIAIPIVSLSARFSLRGVVAGVATTLLIVLLATAAVDFASLLDDPSPTILAAVAVISVGTLSTALMRSDVQHRTEAVIDPLTGLLNRNALQRRAHELEQQSALHEQPVGLVFGDIDRFKAINDEHGHPCGDDVLAEVARRLRGELRAFDLAYRAGGEEFLMLLPGAEPERAAAIAEQMRRAINSESACPGVRVSMSFGVSGSAEGEAFDYARVFEEADAALLRAKRDGRDRVCIARQGEAASVPA